MNKLSAPEVEHIAALSNLTLSPEEKERLQKELAQTIEFINHLKEVETSKVVPTSQVSGKTNQFREDRVEPSLSQAESLRNAPRKRGGFFVAKIIWE